MLLKWLDCALSIFCNVLESLTSVSTYIDSSIRLNVFSSTAASPKHHSKICYWQKCDFFNFVLILSSWFSHWLVMRRTKYHRLCRFFLFFRFSVWRLDTWKQAIKQFTRAVPRKEKCLSINSDTKNIEKYLKITLQQRAHKPYTLCRQTCCSVVGRIFWSTATLRSTSSVDSTGREIGITPVIYEMKTVKLKISGMDINGDPVAQGP